jgi:dCMP deaminase
MIRPDHYYMEMAKEAATLSTCLRRQVGAVAVMGNFTIAQGFNAVPRGSAPCSEVGCLRKELGVPSGQRHEICRAVHAEQAIIAHAANIGLSLKGARLYVTHSPCTICAKLIVSSGIKEVIFAEGYPDDFAEAFLKSAGITLRQI